MGTCPFALHVVRRFIFSFFFIGCCHKSRHNTFHLLYSHHFYLLTTIIQQHEKISKISELFFTYKKGKRIGGKNSKKEKKKRRQAIWTSFQVGTWLGCWPPRRHVMISCTHKAPSSANPNFVQLGACVCASVCVCVCEYLWDAFLVLAVVHQRNMLAFSLMSYCPHTQTHTISVCVCVANGHVGAAFG